MVELAEVVVEVMMEAVVEAVEEVVELEVLVVDLVKHSLRLYCTPTVLDISKCFEHN